MELEALLLNTIWIQWSRNLRDVTPTNVNYFVLQEGEDSCGEKVKKEGGNHNATSQEQSDRKQSLFGLFPRLTNDQVMPT